MGYIDDVIYRGTYEGTSGERKATKKPLDDQGLCKSPFLSALI